MTFFTVTVANAGFSLDFWINIVSLQRLELGKVAKNALKRVGKAPFSVKNRLEKFRKPIKYG